MERLKDPYGIVRGGELTPVYGGALDLLNSIWAHGTLPAPFKELIRLKSASIAGCLSCQNMRYEEALDEGLSEEAIERMRTGKGLTPAEEAAFNYAAAVVSHPEDVAKHLAALRPHFSTSQLAEITMHVLANNMHQSYMASMTKSGDEGGPVRTENIPDRTAAKDLAPVYAEYAKFNAAAWQTGTLSIRLKELLRLKSAQLSLRPDSMKARLPGSGVDEFMANRVWDYARSSLPEKEKTALAVAEILTIDPPSINEIWLTELKLHFTEPQILELTWFAMCYKFNHRFNLAMAELAKLDPSAKVASIPEFAPEVLAQKSGRAA